MSDSAKRKALATATDVELAAASYLWEFEARAEQLPPPGDWLVWLILAGRGWGKMLDVNTPIPTPSGWKRLGDVTIGDEVFDESGRPCKVTATFDGVPEVSYRLTFSDGAQLDACSEHQWVTWTHAERKALLRSSYECHDHFPDEWPSWRMRRKMGREPKRDAIAKALAMVASGASARAAAKALSISRQSLAKHIKAGRYTKREAVTWAGAPGPKVRTTQQIVESLTYGKRNDANHCIPVCGALQTERADLPIDPYVLGAWLGDGHTASGDFTAHELDQPHLRAAIERAGYMTTTRKDAQAVGTRGLLVDLRRAGVLGDKHVPDGYLRASAEQRLGLLRGLMDTDGHIGESGSVVEFSNTNERLVDAVVELATSLGQKPVKSEHTARLNGNNCGRFWRVRWRPTICVFSLPRKVARMPSTKRQALRNHHRMIVSAERIEPRPMRCLTVDGSHSMFLAGKAMIPTHNTRSGAGYVIQRAERNPRARIALVGRTAADVRDVMIEGESGIMAKSPPWFRPVYEPSKRRITWPNGAIATTYSSDKPDQLRGPQHTDAWADELAAWRYPDAWDQLQFGLRLGSAPRAIVTTTPRPTAIVRELLGDATTAVTRGRTLDNRANLSERFISRMLARYEGTRLGRQELDGEVLDDNPGALWKRADIDAARVTAMPELVRVVVGVDPAVSAHEGSAETGIIVAGLGRDGHAYVIADCSVSDTPEKWARAVGAAYSIHRADLVVGEVNNGGDLVEANIRTADRSLPFRAVRASRGKAVRAEPISALYEQGRVHHVGVLAELEDQLTDWDPSAGGASPDRLDALVWALTELDVANAGAGSTARATSRTTYRMGNARGF